MMAVQDLLGEQGNMISTAIQSMHGVSQSMH